MAACLRQVNLFRIDPNHGVSGDERGFCPHLMIALRAMIDVTGAKLVVLLDEPIAAFRGRQHMPGERLNQFANVVQYRHIQIDSPANLRQLINYEQRGPRVQIDLWCRETSRSAHVNLDGTRGGQGNVAAGGDDSNVTLGPNPERRIRIPVWPPAIRRAANPRRAKREGHRPSNQRV
jgi:hypothetical protein